MHLHCCSGLARVVNANFPIFAHCGQKLSIWAPCHAKDLNITHKRKQEEEKTKIKWKVNVVFLVCVSKQLQIFKISKMETTVYNMMFYPPGPRVQRGLWPHLRCPGSTVWLWDHRMKTPAARWPEGGTWWSKSSPCDLWGVTASVSQLGFYCFVTFIELLPSFIWNNSHRRTFNEVFILQIFTKKSHKTLCCTDCASNLWINTPIQRKLNWGDLRWSALTLQDELRLSQGLLQASLRNPPHTDLCIITSYGDTETSTSSHPHIHLNKTTSSCKYSHQYTCIHLPTASRCVSKGSQAKSTTLTEFWMVGMDVSGNLPGWERWGEKRNTHSGLIFQSY